MVNKRYNGWTNYETWAVKLWMDNDQDSYNYWREVTKKYWQETGDMTPNQFMDHDANARQLLMDRLKDEYDDQSEHPVFEAAKGSVYADLLRAALNGVDWREIADALLSDYAESQDEPSYRGLGKES